MIKLHFRVKFRAFGITFSTVEESIDISFVVQMFLKAIKGVPQDLLFALETSGISGAYLKLEKPVKLYDDRGVFIELV